MDWPSLSVIIPSFNQGRYIERTLLSILKQGYPGPLEVIVSDGGSTDETVAVLRRYPQVRWWSEPDRGFVDAVTRGLAAATGEVVAIQSSDDYYLQGAFARAVPVLRREPGLAFVTGNEVRIDQHGRALNSPPMPYVTLLGPGGLIGRTTGMYVPQHCTFARRSAVDRVNGLREEVDMCADLDLWYRLLHFGRGLKLPDYLAVYQMHPAQRMQSKADLWIAAQKKVIEDAERDPVYAGRFVPTPEMKRHIFLQWEIGWRRQAGGDEGLRESLALAREALRTPGDWPDYMLDFLRAHSRAPAGGGAGGALLRRVKGNAAVRALFGKGPVPQETVLWDETLDLDWWQKNGTEILQPDS